MATRSIDELLPEVLVYVPNAPDIVAHRYIREAARKLCHDARILRRNVVLVVKAGGAQVFPTLVDVEFVQIETARINGHVLDHVTTEWLDANSPPNWDYGPDGVTARYITQLTPDTVSLVPNEKGNLIMRCVFQPSRNCLTIDAELVDLYGTVIGRGAAAQMLMLPGADFANPNLGMAMYSEFMAKVSSLKIETVKGQQGAPLRTRGVWF